MQPGRRAPLSPGVQPTIPKVTASAPRILLVDDEAVVQKLLTYPLRKEGYDVPDPEAGKGIQINGDIPQDVMNKCFSQVGNK